MVAVALALAVALAAAPVPEPTFTPPGEPVAPEVAPRDAVTALADAQRLRDAGELVQAETAATEAIDLDPAMAAAHLARAQIRVERVDIDTTIDLRDRARLLRAAADDLATYIDRAVLPDDQSRWFATRRDELLARADELDELAKPAPAAPPAPAPIAAPKPRPVVVDTPPPRRRPPRELALVGVGSATAVGGAVASAFALRVQQRCSALCSARFETQSAAVGAAIALTAMASVFSPWATWTLTRHATDSKRASRRATIAGAVLLGIGSAATITGSALLGVSATRWNTLTPSDDDDLATTQRLANAGAVAFSLAIPTALTGIVALIAARRR
jgi:hypothetical protein